MQFTCFLFKLMNFHLLLQQSKREVFNMLVHTLTSADAAEHQVKGALYAMHNTAFVKYFAKKLDVLKVCA